MTGFGYLLNELVFRGKDHVCGAKQGVGPCGENRDGLVYPVDSEINFRACRSPDPVPLHVLDAFGPVEAVDTLKQPFGIMGDTEHPLLKVPFLHRVSALFMCSVIQHLLIGANDPAVRAPPHLRVVVIGKPFRVDEFPDLYRPGL